MYTIYDILTSEHVISSKLYMLAKSVISEVSPLIGSQSCMYKAFVTTSFLYNIYMLYIPNVYEPPKASKEHKTCTVYQTIHSSLNLRMKFHAGYYRFLRQLIIYA